MYSGFSNQAQPRSSINQSQPRNEFVYKHGDFPKPDLPNDNKAEMAEMSQSIKHLQGCMEKVLNYIKYNNNQQPQPHSCTQSGQLQPQPNHVFQCEAKN